MCSFLTHLETCPRKYKHVFKPRALFAPQQYIHDYLPYRNTHKTEKNDEQCYQALYVMSAIIFSIFIKFARSPDNFLLAEFILTDQIKKGWVGGGVLERGKSSQFSLCPQAFFSKIVVSVFRNFRQRIFFSSRHN